MFICLYLYSNLCVLCLLRLKAKKGDLFFLITHIVVVITLDGRLLLLEAFIRPNNIFFACLVLPHTAPGLNIHYVIIRPGPFGRHAGPVREGEQGGGGTSTAHQLSSPVNTLGVR